MIDLSLIQKECAIIALKRGNITQEDLILPNVDKFLKKIKEETIEADVCNLNADYKTRIVNGKPEGLLTELSDIILTCLTLFECLGASAKDEITLKLEYNKIRKD